MWRSVVLSKSTKIYAPPQVFLSLNEGSGSELWKLSRLLFAVK